MSSYSWEKCTRNVRRTDNFTSLTENYGAPFEGRNNPLSTSGTVVSKQTFEDNYPGDNVQTSITRMWKFQGSSQRHSHSKNTTATRTKVIQFGDILSQYSTYQVISREREREKQRERGGERERERKRKREREIIQVCIRVEMGTSFLLDAMLTLQTAANRYPLQITSPTKEEVIRHGTARARCFIHEVWAKSPDLFVFQSNPFFFILNKIPIQHSLHRTRNNGQNGFTKHKGRAKRERERERAKKKLKQSARVTAMKYGCCAKNILREL